MSGLTLPTSVARERHWKPTPVSPLVLAAGKVNPDINPKLFPNTNRNPKVWKVVLTFTPMEERWLDTTESVILHYICVLVLLIVRDLFCVLIWFIFTFINAYIGQRMCRLMWLSAATGTAAWSVANGSSGWNLSSDTPRCTRSWSSERTSSTAHWIPTFCFPTGTYCHRPRNFRPTSCQRIRHLYPISRCPGRRFRPPCRRRIQQLRQIRMFYHTAWWKICCHSPWSSPQYLRHRNQHPSLKSRYLSLF